MDSQYPFEKLGLLYLGKELDLNTGAPSNLPLLYKNKNLTTHGIIIGMTGSGKTGLGIGLIEEAIMDNVPSIIIDPKGDMGNLMLTFPECKGSDFVPWLDPAEAAKKEMSVEQYGEKCADTWKKGLAEWGQGLDRIKSLKEKTRVTLYTPGSSAGVSVSVLSSFNAPSKEVQGDTDTLNSLVNSTVTGLLALVDITGDPLQSREHILLSSLFLYFWRNDHDLTMESLIGHIVNPPFDKVGVFPLDTFYGQSDRMTLAMQLNNIIASPTFAAWTEGVPLDIQKILYGADAKPQTAIFSIAHLSEAERMFFVTMLLNQLIGWMRRQQGSSSLKALLYMDEIFGYFPPTANPPSKKPMMLLLKQARAFGVGVVLATQNPVDLDYKGLSNMGTWFVGRLQTKQDQSKVADGIVGASDGQLDRRQVEKLLSDMQGRQFLLNSAHLDAPLLFQTRWVMSYLKGPISTKDIKVLMKDKKEDVASQVVEQSPVSSRSTGGVSSGETNHLPMLSSDIEQLFFLHNVLAEQISFEPWLTGSASVRFFNAKRNIDEVEEVNLRIYLDESSARFDWDEAEENSLVLDDCLLEPPSESLFYPLPSNLVELKNFKIISKAFSDFLYHNKRLELYRVSSLKLESTPEESLADFKIRFGDHLRDKKEEEIEKLQNRYEVKQKRLEQRLGKALDRVEKEKIDVRSKTTDSLLSFGAAVVGAFFGRKVLSSTNIGKAATGFRNVGRVAKEKSDVRRAEEDLAEIQLAIEELSQEIDKKVAELEDSFVAENYDIETFSIKPRRSDIFDLRVILLWEMVA